MIINEGKLASVIADQLGASVKDLIAAIKVEMRAKIRRLRRGQQVRNANGA
jgi:hypothetical protein